jgi:hypothetical protein
VNDIPLIKQEDITCANTTSHKSVVSYNPPPTRSTAILHTITWGVADVWGADLLKLAEAAQRGRPLAQT